MEPETEKDTQVVVYLENGTTESFPGDTTWQVLDDSINLHLFDPARKNRGSYARGIWSHVRREPGDVKESLSESVQRRISAGVVFKRERRGDVPTSDVQLVGLSERLSGDLSLRFERPLHVGVREGEVHQSAGGDEDPLEVVDCVHRIELDIHGSARFEVLDDESPEEVDALPLVTVSLYAKSWVDGEPRHEVSPVVGAAPSVEGEGPAVDPMAGEFGTGDEQVNPGSAPGAEGVGVDGASPAPAPDPARMGLTRHQRGGVTYVTAHCPCGEWFQWRQFADGPTSGARRWLAGHILHVEESRGRPGPIPSFEQAFDSADDAGEECRS